MSRWPRVKEILADALALTPEARPAYLVEACAADPELRCEVESLLAANREAALSFPRRPGYPRAWSPPTAPPGCSTLASPRC
jgi:hypothetical protein